MHSYFGLPRIYINFIIGLNPCCNGRCTRTNANDVESVKAQVVLILVVMEDALVPTQLNYHNYKSPDVLILVVMEDALVRQMHHHP